MSDRGRDHVQEIHDLTNDSKSCYDEEDYETAYDNVLEIYGALSRLEKKINDDILERKRKNEL